MVPPQSDLNLYPLLICYFLRVQESNIKLISNETYFRNIKNEQFQIYFSVWKYVQWMNHNHKKVVILPAVFSFNLVSICIFLLFKYHLISIPRGVFPLHAVRIFLMLKTGTVTLFPQNQLALLEEPLDQYEACLSSFEYIFRAMKVSN